MLSTHNQEKELGVRYQECCNMIACNLTG